MRFECCVWIVMFQSSESQSHEAQVKLVIIFVCLHDMYINHKFFINLFVKKQSSPERLVYLVNIQQIFYGEFVSKKKNNFFYNSCKNIFFL